MTSPAARRAITFAILLGTTVLAAACGSAGQTSSGQAGAAPTASASSAAAAPSQSSAAPAPASPRSSGQALTGCSSSALKARVAVSQSSGAAGSIYYPIDFTNVSSTSCTMFGYPGVSFVTGPGGAMLGRPATRNPTAPPATVTLAPGGVAHATLQVAEAGNYTPSQCRPVTGHLLKIYPPNQFTAIYAKLTTRVCSAKLPRPAGSQLIVYAVSPGAGKAGQGP